MTTIQSGATKVINIFEVDTGYLSEWVRKKLNEQNSILFGMGHWIYSFMKSIKFSVINSSFYFLYDLG